MSSPGWSTSPQAHPPNFPQPLNGGRFYSKEYSQYEELTSGFVRGFEEPDYEPRPSQFKFQPSTTEFSRDSSSGNRMRPTVWNDKDVRLQNGTYPTSTSEIQETDILGDEASSGEEEEKAMKHRPQLQPAFMPCCCSEIRVVPTSIREEKLFIVSSNVRIFAPNNDSLNNQRMEAKPAIKTEILAAKSNGAQSDSSDDEIRTPIRRRRELNFSSGNQSTQSSTQTKNLLFPSNSHPKNPCISESISANFKDGFIEGIDDTMTQVAPILRTMSLRVRQQVQSTLSDPLKRRADKISTELRESKKRVELFSAKLHVPAFLNNSVRSLISNDAAASSSEEAESDDPEVFEQIERERIIEMYEKGPENPRIDEWENPDWDVRKTDRHGFIHKERLSEAERAKSEKERIETEIKREKKWLSMLSHWDAKRPVKKLNERVWKGVPLKLRIRVWPKLLGIEELKAQSRGEDIYAKLVDRARLISKEIKQIDLDINRTYRDNQTFRRRYDIKQRSLLNVLAAYSMYNTEIGYCQGMSQIAALFLMFLDEEEAFWCLHALMVSERHSMHGFFAPGFPKLQRFEEHFQKILKKYKPKVYKRFEKEGIPYIYLTKWWFGCFLASLFFVTIIGLIQDRVPFPLALRLWDVFLYEGDTILMAMAINIMKMHERTIRKLTLETFMEFIQSTMAEDFQFPDDEVMKSLREVLTKLISDRTQRPPPPGPGALPERPTKAFGPVLSRSLKEIQDQVSELRSRSSRANSVATSRTPQSRRRNGRNHQSPATPLNKDLKTGPSPINETAIPNHQVPFQIPSRGSLRESNPAFSTSASNTRAVRPMGLAGREQMKAHSQGRLPPSQLSSNSLRTRGNPEATSRPNNSMIRNSTYENVQNQTPDGEQSSPVRTVGIRDEHSGKMVFVVRGGDNDESPTADAQVGTPKRVSQLPSAEPPSVTHLANHVTYVTIGDEEDADQWMSRV